MTRRGQTSHLPDREAVLAKLRAALECLRDRHRDYARHDHRSPGRNPAGRFFGSAGFISARMASNTTLN